MKKMKSNVAKSLIIIALLCPVAFADGDQGSGGFADNDTPVVKTSGSGLEGDQGSGGLAEQSYIDTVLKSAADYFNWMIS